MQPVCAQQQRHDTLQVLLVLHTFGAQGIQAFHRQLFLAAWVVNLVPHSLGRTGSGDSCILITHPG